MGLGLILPQTEVQPQKGPSEILTFCKERPIWGGDPLGTIIQLYIALNRTANIDCYSGGSIQGNPFCSSLVPKHDS